MAGALPAAAIVSLGHTALEATKVRATSSRNNAMSYAGLTEKRKVLATEISDLMAEARPWTRPRTPVTMRANVGARAS